MKLCGISVGEEGFDVSKISKGISKLLKESKNDPDEVMRRLSLGKEYATKMGWNDWTPEAVWKHWEKIKNFNNKKTKSLLYD